MKRILYIVLFGLLLNACNNSQQSNNEDGAKLLSSEKIRQQEVQLMNSKTMVADQGKAANLVKDYVSFANKYHTDSLAPEYLFKAAELDANVLGAGQAQNIYDRIIANYPGYRKMPQVYFLKGYVYEQRIHDKDQAKIYYEKMIKKFPDHPLSIDARQLVKHLSLTDEELIKRLKEGRME
jgi:outer membrane protein assembly factor BamD (BamD/ComL family)